LTSLRAGLIGYPLDHSKAHRLYQYWLSKHAISGTYEIVAVEAKELETRLRQLVSDGWRGGSVTMPHKVAALAIADDISERAHAIGSTNTLIFENGRIIADNFDGVGFLKSLNHTAGKQFNSDKPVLVFGAGGASRAVLHSLLDAGVPEIRLCNRTQDRAEALAQRFGTKVRVVEWSNAESAMPGAGAVVNTTSMGMNKNPPLPFKLDRIDDDAVAVDIVNTPQLTPFLDAAQTRGLTIVKGLGMLLHQAPPGFEAWYGVKPVVDDEVRDAMLALY